MKKALTEVITVKEAADLWRKDESNLRKEFVKSIKDEGKFKANELRKSGKVWLVEKKAMERVFGKLEDGKFEEYINKNI